MYINSMVHVIMFSSILLLLSTGIREYLLENEFKCFACEETDVSPDTLVSNKRLRNVSHVTIM